MLPSEFPFTTPLGIRVVYNTKKLEGFSIHEVRAALAKLDTTSVAWARAAAEIGFCDDPAPSRSEKSPNETFLLWALGRRLASPHWGRDQERVRPKRLWGTRGLGVLKSILRMLRRRRSVKIVP